MKNMFKKMKLNRSGHDRVLRCEALEDRLLLSVTQGISSAELREIESAYSYFNYNGITAEDALVIAPDAGSSEISRADLEEALTYAADQARADLIVVRTTDTVNTIKFTSASDVINISDSYGVTIIAYGSKPLTIDANAFDNTWQSRILNNRVSYYDGEEYPSFLQIGFVDFINGYTQEYGGAIDNFKSTLILDDCCFYNNAAQTGGSIYSANRESDFFEVYRSRFEGNAASYSGGAVFFTNGNVIIQESSFYDNSAGEQGGALSMDYVVPELTDLIFSGNKAKNGAALYSISGALVLNFCTFANNDAEYNGGAIYKSSDSLSIYNSSLYENTAGHYGGAVYAGGTSTTIIGSTITENTAVTYGGGIYNTASHLTILNSILLWNTADKYADLYSLSQRNIYIVNNVFYGSPSYSYSNVTIDNELNSLITYRSSYTLDRLKVFASIDLETGLAIPEKDGTLALYTSGNADKAGTLIGFINNDSSVNYYYLGTVSSKKYWINISDKTVKYLFDSTNSDGYYGLSQGALEGETTGIFRQAQNFIDGFPASRTFNLNAFTAGAWSGYHEAASTIVTTIADRIDNGDGLISLREAILYAQEGDLISFAPVLYDQNGRETSDRRFVLTGGALEFNKSVTVNGEGTGIILDLNQTDPLFYVYGDSVFVEIDGLTMTGALSGTEFVDSGQNYAGSIFNSADLILKNCTIKGNRIVTALESGTTASIQYGTAICNVGTMALIGCTVTGNESVISGTNNGSVLGGAVFNSGTLTILNSVLTGNNPLSQREFDLINSGTTALIYSVCGSYLGELALNVENADAMGKDVFISSNSDWLTDNAGVPYAAVDGAAWNAGTLVARKGSELYYINSSLSYYEPAWIRVSDGEMIGYYDAADTGDYGLNITGAELFLTAQNRTGTGESALRKTAPGQMTAGAWTPQGISIDPFFQISVGETLPVSVSDTTGTVSRWQLNIYRASDTTLKTSLLNASFNKNTFTVNTASLDIGDYIVKIDACSSTGSVIQTLKSELSIKTLQPEFNVVKNNFCENQLVRLAINAVLPTREPVIAWTINWGDGQVSDFSNTAFSLAAIHFYEDFGVYSITLAITTESGNWNERLWSIATHYYNGNNVYERNSESEAVTSALEEIGRYQTDPKTLESLTEIDWDLLLISLEEEKQIF